MCTNSSDLKRTQRMADPLECKGSKLRIGFVLDRAFQEEGRWTSATTSHLVRGILNRFECCIIENQAEYEENLGDVQALISMEAGWGAPILDLRPTTALAEALQSRVSYMLYSDPHDKKWREDYVLNGIDYVLAFYAAPTRFHFTRLPSERLVHFPWAIPDFWLASKPPSYHCQDRLTIFGASQHEAYQLRNWCRRFPFVESCTNSGCENKLMTDDEYMTWLASRDAVIAAGSDDLRYCLTTPKYFEAAAVGALLFAQATDDLEELGFRHMENCVIFDRSNFESLALSYLNDPTGYLGIREAGCELVRRRHSLSVRLDQLEKHIRENLERVGRPLSRSFRTDEPVGRTEPVLPCLQPPDSAHTGSNAHESVSFVRPEDVYYASADRMDRVLTNLAQLQRLDLRATDSYATVIGGLSGLNYLLAFQPQRVVFYDVNPAAIDYGRFILEMIRLSSGPGEFISRMFARSIEGFLSHSGEACLTVGNQQEYLARPIEQALWSGTLDHLSAKGREVYQYQLGPRIQGTTLPGIYNCRRLLPCWPVNERVPVGGGVDCGYDDAGRLIPNTNTFFYGHGWLESQAAFDRVKDVLARSELNFLLFELLHGNPAELCDLSGPCILHVSNIDEWFPQVWPQWLDKWQQAFMQAQGHLTLITSHNGLTPMRPDPHAYAHAAVASHVFGTVVEVTHKVPWGFDELPRTNVTVPEYLTNPFPADTTILHILIGEKIPQCVTKEVYEKALAQSRRVLVLEHNKDSDDWAPSPPDYFMGEEELRDFLLASLQVHAVRAFLRLRGEKDGRRNLLAVLDTPRASVAPSLRKAECCESRERTI